MLSFSPTRPFLLGREYEAIDHSRRRRGSCDARSTLRCPAYMAWLAALLLLGAACTRSHPGAGPRVTSFTPPVGAIVGSSRVASTRYSPMRAVLVSRQDSFLTGAIRTPLPGSSIVVDIPSAWRRAVI